MTPSGNVSVQGVVRPVVSSSSEIVNIRLLPADSSGQSPSSSEEEGNGTGEATEGMGEKNSEMIVVAAVVAVLVVAVALGVIGRKKRRGLRTLFAQPPKPL